MLCLYHQFNNCHSEAKGLDRRISRDVWCLIAVSRLFGQTSGWKGQDIATQAEGFRELKMTIFSDLAMYKLTSHTRSQLNFALLPLPYTLSAPV